MSKETDEALHRIAGAVEKQTEEFARLTEAFNTLSEGLAVAMEAVLNQAEDEDTAPAFDLAGRPLS